MFTSNYADTIRKAQNGTSADSAHSEIMRNLSAKHGGAFTHLNTVRTREGIVHLKFLARPEHEVGQPLDQQLKSATDKLSRTHHISTAVHTFNASRVMLTHKKSGTPHIVSLYDPYK